MESASAATCCLGFLLLTGNTIAAIRRSRADADASATAFVAATSYACFLLLLYSLRRRFETSPTGSAAKGRARAAVWVATTLLTAIFSWRASALMPWPVSAGVCLMGAATVVGGFYALFLCSDPTGD